MRFLTVLIKTTVKIRENLLTLQMLVHDRGKENLKRKEGLESVVR